MKWHCGTRSNEQAAAAGSAAVQGENNALEPLLWPKATGYWLIARAVAVSIVMHAALYI